MVRKNMSLPMVKRCCFCIPLETGFNILCLFSTSACLASLTMGAWDLPRNKEREPEDNLISMSLIMFSILCTIGNVAAAAGAYLRRPGYLQLSLMFNWIFMPCFFLLAIVTGLYSPEMQKSHFLDSGGNIALFVILMIAGALYSLYYLVVVNSLYRRMKSDFTTTIPTYMRRGMDCGV